MKSTPLDYCGGGVNFFAERVLWGFIQKNRQYILFLFVIYVGIIGIRRGVDTPGRKYRIFLKPRS